MIAVFRLDVSCEVWAAEGKPWDTKENKELTPFDEPQQETGSSAKVAVYEC